MHRIWRWCDLDPDQVSRQHSGYIANGQQDQEDRRQAKSLDHPQRKSIQNFHLIISLAVVLYNLTITLVSLRQYMLP